jgi:hypothetical protein
MQRLAAGKPEELDVDFDRKEGPHLMGGLVDDREFLQFEQPHMLSDELVYT